MQVWFGALLTISLYGSATVVVHFAAANLVLFPGVRSGVPGVALRLRFIRWMNGRIRDMGGIIKVTHRTEG
jgi:hypothetical protein